MDESPILVETRPNFRIVTLNRPQRLNAFTEDMHRAEGRARRGGGRFNAAPC